MLLINNYSSKLGVVAALVLIAACSQPPVVPLDDHSFAQPKRTIHVAGSGDTLYSIAFLAGLDYKEVAAWNNISEPYLINRGQKISLVKPKNFTKPAQTDDVINPIASSSTTIETEAAKPQSQVVKLSPPPNQQNTTPNKFIPFDNSWHWPIAAMNIVNYKKSSRNNGLDIISKQGVSVKASAAGKVVYAGNSLKGYGNLVIIKHSDTYLSAYAHNKSITVKEGDRIAQGQKIAEVGRSDANQAKLHFEIRKNGKPVSPLGLLPKKVG